MQLPSPGPFILVFIHSFIHPHPPGPDCKMRFFHRLGPRPAHTKYAELNAAPVSPDALCARFRLDLWKMKMNIVTQQVDQNTRKVFANDIGETKKGIMMGTPESRYKYRICTSQTPSHVPQ